MNPAWAIEGFLETKNGVLHIDGVSTINIAEKHDTPVFVFSEKRIQHNVNRLLKIGDVIDCKIKVCYAAKANSDKRVLETVKNAGSDIEVNSGGELKMALDAGFLPEQIIFNGNSKTEKELAAAIEAGIYAIQSDSFYELELTEKVAKNLGMRANVSLRLVPEIESETLHGLQTALLTSKFGMMPEEALDAFRRWSPDDEFMNLCGIHLHIGSQNPTSEPYSQAFFALFENLVKIFQVTGHRLQHLNLGGGFPVNYLRDDSNAGDMPLSQKELFAADLEPSEVVRNAWESVKLSAEKADALHFLNDITLLVEPGRSIIADAGICLTKVRNKKERPIRAEKNSKTDHNLALSRDTWLLTDAGFNILLSMEIYKWYYHLVSAARAGDSHATPYKVAGPLCDGGDVYFDIEGKKRLPDYRLLPENIEVGDVLALFNCGAYSVSQMFPYNGRELPEIVYTEEFKTS